MLAVEWVWSAEPIARGLRYLKERTDRGLANLGRGNEGLREPGRDPRSPRLESAHAARLMGAVARGSARGGLSLSLPGRESRPLRRARV
jgi:hypothetical protein